MPSGITPFLYYSPAAYSIRTPPLRAIRSQEAQEMELAVAGRLEVTFLLRPLKDVWEARGCTAAC